MHKSASACALLLLFGFWSTPAVTQDTHQQGKEIFDLWCAGCHAAVPEGAPQLAGTGSLQRKYEGELPAALEERTDLNADYLAFLVRNGSKSMPQTRKTEINDAQLKALIEYLTRNNPQD